MIENKLTFFQWMKLINSGKPFIYLKSGNMIMFLPTPKEMKLIFKAYNRR